jgi:hypothetical protein
MNKLIEIVLFVCLFVYSPESDGIDPEEAYTLVGPFWEEERR